MENIADALRMAGGLLLALLLISLLVFSFNIINRSEDARADQKLIQDSQEFNKKFLAFEKSSMYGTDLISILGLAISNNETYNQEKTMYPDGRYDSRVDGSINVVFELDKPVTEITRVYKRRYWEEIEGKRVYINDWKEQPSTMPPAEIFKAKHKYTLEIGDSPSDKENFDKIIKMVVNGNGIANIDVKTVGNTRTVVDGTGFNDLKLRIFECTDIRYNKTGKINYMSFKEKDKSN